MHAQTWCKGGERERLEPSYPQKIHIYQCHVVKKFSKQEPFSPLKNEIIRQTPTKTILPMRTWHDNAWMHFSSLLLSSYNDCRVKISMDSSAEFIDENDPTYGPSQLEISVLWVFIFIWQILFQNQDTLDSHRLSVNLHCIDPWVIEVSIIV